MVVRKIDELLNVSVLGILRRRRTALREHREVHCHLLLEVWWITLPNPVLSCASYMYITSPLISNLLLSLCRFFWPNACGIEVVSFEVLVNDRAGYRLRCFAVVEAFERKVTLGSSASSRELRKQRKDSSSSSSSPICVLHVRAWKGVSLKNKKGSTGIKGAVENCSLLSLFSVKLGNIFYLYWYYLRMAYMCCCFFHSMWIFLADFNEWTASPPKCKQRVQRKQPVEEDMVMQQHAPSTGMNPQQRGIRW